MVVIKKLIFFSVFLILTFITLNSCKQENIVNENTDITIYSPTKLTAINTEFYENFEYIDGYVKIVYPQFNELSYEVNKIIKQSALKNYQDNVNPKFLSENEVASAIYEISESEVSFLNENLISIKYSGFYNESTAPHQTNLFYSSIIDIKAEKELNTTDIITNFDNIISLFKEGKFKQVFGLKELLDLTTYDDMITQYSSINEVYPQIYLTENALGMNIELVHALSGNARFEIPYSEIKNDINKEVISWQNLS